MTEFSDIRQPGVLDPSTVQFETRYGRQVVPEMPLELLGEAPVNAWETEEGFIVGGENDTSHIRGLTSINGKPVANLEQVMQPGNSSTAGFLGHEESLVQVLADDNEAVRRMGLSHPQLAHFMRYARGILRHFAEEKNFEDEAAFIYNNRTFVARVMGWRGAQESPFDSDRGSADYEVLCLEDGSKVDYSSLIPDMVEKYGFYEGRHTPYRVDPAQVARVSGLHGAIDADDPVVQLVQQPDSAVHITTVDEAKRLGALRRYSSLNLFSSPNYRLIPADTDSFLRMIPTMLDYKQRKWGQPVPDQQAIAHLDGSQLSPQDLRPSNHQLHTLMHAVAFDATLRDVVLQNTASIRLGAASSSSEAMFMYDLLRKKDNLPELAPVEQCMHSLLAKLDLADPHTQKELYDAFEYSVRKAKEGFREYRNQAELAQLLDEAVPQFREYAAAYIRAAHVSLADDASTEELIAARADVKAYESMLKEQIGFAHNIGKFAGEITLDAMHIAVEVIEKSTEDRAYTITKDEVATLATIGIDPELIPAALVVTSGYERGQTYRAIQQLYNGVAARYQAFEPMLKSLEGFINDEAKASLSYMDGTSVRMYGERGRIHTEKVLARLGEIIAERRAAGNVESLQITDEDVEKLRKEIKP